MNAEAIIKEWIATARDLGRAVPEPKGRLLYAQQACAAARD